MRSSSLHAIIHLDAIQNNLLFPLFHCQREVELFLCLLRNCILRKSISSFHSFWHYESVQPYVISEILYNSWYWTFIFHFYFEQVNDKIQFPNEYLASKFDCFHHIFRWLMTILRLSDSDWYFSGEINDFEFLCTKKTNVLKMFIAFNDISNVLKTHFDFSIEIFSKHLYFALVFHSKLWIPLLKIIF